MGPVRAAAVVLVLFRLIDEDEGLGIDGDAGRREGVVQLAQRRRRGDLGFEDPGRPWTWMKIRSLDIAFSPSGPGKGRLRRKRCETRKMRGSRRAHAPHMK